MTQEDTVRKKQLWWGMIHMLGGYHLLNVSDDYEMLWGGAFFGLLGIWSLCYSYRIIFKE